MSQLLLSTLTHLIQRAGISKDGIEPDIIDINK